MSSSGLLSRRRVMGAAGATALFAPFWRIATGQAQSAAFPRRLLLVFTPNGTVVEEFFPTGGERDFRFRRILAPLERWRSKVMVLRGVDIQMGGPGDGHQRGAGGLWTGQRLRNGSDTGWPLGMSVDQRVADEIGAATRFRSIQLGYDIYNSQNLWTRMIYRGSGEPVPPELNPRRAFDRVFEGFTEPDPSTDSAIERRRRIRRTVLDRSLSELRSLRRRLGTADAARLERHADALRDLEARLNQRGAAPLGSACVVPSRPGAMDLGNDANNEEVLARMSEIMVMSFACDATRVGSLQWTHAAAENGFPSLGIGTAHHDLAHQPNSRAQVKEDLTRINEYYAARFAELLEQLDSVPEGDGTLLDHTLVVWGNEQSNGETHSHESIPFVLAGGGGGAIEMGRYLEFNGASHTDLLTSILRAFDIDENFGDSRWSNGPLI